MRLTEAWGVPVVVDNRPGAGGNLAGDIVAKAAPDGLTLLMGTIGILTVNPFLYTKMPFDAQRAFAPVTMTATAGTPQANVDKLNAEVVRILALPEVRTQYQVAGLYATSTTPAAFGTYIATEREKWGKLAKSADLKPE